MQGVECDGCVSNSGDCRAIDIDKETFYWHCFECEDGWDYCVKCAEETRVI